MKRFDKYLNWIKNNKLLSLIILVGAIVIALGDFSDAILKIKKLPSNIVGSNEKEIIVRVRISNRFDYPIIVNRYLQYDLTESIGLMIKEYPGGRIYLEPMKNAEDRDPWHIDPRRARFYKAALPNRKTFGNLLDRGSANIHFVLRLDNGPEYFIQTMPFHEKAFEEWYVAFNVIKVPNDKEQTVNKANSADAKSRAAD